MNNLFNIKIQQGVSLITVVITIIVLIIIASISLIGNNGTIDSAILADYVAEIKSVEVRLATQRVDNQKSGIGEEYKEKGFYKVYIDNPPTEFQSFSNEEFYGYIVNLEILSGVDTAKGKDYEKYSVFDENRLLVFGEDGRDNDVFVYDANGKVFYAKGYHNEDGDYYNDNIF